MGHNAAGDNRRRRLKRAARERQRLLCWAIPRPRGAPGGGRHFCTYFDQGYLPRGLALHSSLVRHAWPFSLHALCLDSATYDALLRLRLPGLLPLRLEEVEEADPALAEAKRDRSRVEYYFTLTPSLPLYVLDHCPGVDVITYLDADLYFFADPAPVYEGLGRGSVLIIPHRFPPALKHAEAYGIYNVGLLCFRNDVRGRACLGWWRERCLEWCYDRLEDGRFADQKYVDDWPERFAGVVVLGHRGANLAPWNVSGHRLRQQRGKVFVDGDPLIFYHFHGLRALSTRSFDLGLDLYHAPLGRVLERGVYRPYLRKLRSLAALARETGGKGSAARLDGRPASLRGPRLVLA